MGATLTPFATHSSITPGTASAAIATITRSIGPGTAARLGYAVRPQISGALGWIGYSLPGYPKSTRCLTARWPTFRSSVEAPTTAIERGAKTACMASPRLEDPLPPNPLPPRRAGVGGGGPPPPPPPPPPGGGGRGLGGRGSSVHDPRVCDHHP